MPLYEYSCEDCGTTFEQLVSARNRDNGVECPECGSKDVERLLSAFAIGKSGTGSSTAASCPTGTCSLGL
jgi:putative FmdB family regulatory protein